MPECSCPSALEAVKAARDLLENVTPLPTDCGAFCSAACCKDDPDYETSGMLLFPGEEALYDNPCREDGWRFFALRPCARGQARAAAQLQLPCPRRMRPLACRLFPLTPYFKGDKLTVRIDVRARPVCPCAIPALRGFRRSSSPPSSRRCASLGAARTTCLPPHPDRASEGIRVAVREGETSRKFTAKGQPSVRHSPATSPYTGGFGRRPLAPFVRGGLGAFPWLPL